MTNLFTGKWRAPSMFSNGRFSAMFLHLKYVKSLELTTKLVLNWVNMTQQNVFTNWIKGKQSWRSLNNLQSSIFTYRKVSLFSITAVKAKSAIYISPTYLLQVVYLDIDNFPIDFSRLEETLALDFVVHSELFGQCQLALFVPISFRFNCEFYKQNISCDSYLAYIHVLNRKNTLILFRYLVEEYFWYKPRHFNQIQITLKNHN